VKHVIVLALMSIALVACASSQSTGTAGSKSDATAEVSASSGRKKVCKRDRNPRVGTRVRRTCRYVDVDETTDRQNSN
jgi:hypothetical protein